MVLLCSHKAFGGLRVYDVRRYVNLNRIRPAFERLRTCRDRAMYRLDEHGSYARVPPAAPGLGDVQGDDDVKSAEQYLVDGDRRALVQCLHIFAECADAPDTASILLQMQRTECKETGAVRIPLTPGGRTKRGVICVAQEGSEGGLLELLNSSGQVMHKEVSPGFMAIYRDSEVTCRVTDVVCAPGHASGWRDVLLMSF